LAPGNVDLTRLGRAPQLRGAHPSPDPAPLGCRREKPTGIEGSLTAACQLTGRCLGAVQPPERLRHGPSADREVPRLLVRVDVVPPQTMPVPVEAHPGHLARFNPGLPELPPIVSAVETKFIGGFPTHMEVPMSTATAWRSRRHHRSGRCPGRRSRWCRR
jgi:hypothetical protein